jgi:hypothetical protein
VVGSITATGTASLASESGAFHYWGVPGSSWTSSLDEVITTSPVTNPPSPGGLLPEYPTYNNPLGTFALLKTPVIKIKKTQHSILEGYSLSPPWDDLNCHYQDYTKFQVFFDAEELKYLFNPALKLNEEKTEILASIVIKPKVSVDQFVSSTECINNPILSWNDEVFCSQCIQQNEYNATMKLFNGDNLVTGVEVSDRYSPPVPIDYINEMLVGFLTRNGAEIDEFEYYVRFTLKMTSHNLGKDSKPVENTQIMTFPLNAELFTGTIPIPLIDIVSDLLPANLGGPEYLDEVEGTNFSDGYISISGLLSSENGDESEVLSANVIHLQPGANIKPDIRLAIGYPFQGSYPQVPVASNFIHDFCTNQISGLTYEANQFSAKAQELPPIPVELLEPYFRESKSGNGKIDIYPNPANGAIQLRSSNLGISQVDVYDIAGRLMLQRNYGADVGKQVQMDIQNLQSGVYIVQIHCGAQVHKEKLVVGL